MAYNLTPEQESMVRQMVHLQRTENARTFVHESTMGGSGFAVEGVVRVSAEQVDVDAIEQAGLLAVRWDPTGATCALKPSAAEAVRTDFGIPKDRRFLLALYEIASGTTMWVLLGDVAKRANLTQPQAEATAMDLTSRGLIRNNSGGGGRGTVVFLEPRGIAVCERSSTTPASGSIIQNFLGNVGAVQSGNNAQAHVDQRSAGVEPAPALRELQQRVMDFERQQMLVAHTLQDIIDTLEEPNRDKAELPEKVQALAAAGKSIAEFASSVLAAVSAFRHPGP